MQTFRRAWRWFTRTLDAQSNGTARAVIAVFVGFGLLVLLPVAVLYELVTAFGRDRFGTAARWAIAGASFFIIVLVAAALNSPDQVAVAPTATPEPSTQAPTPTPLPSPTRTPRPTPMPTASPVPTPSPIPTATPEPGFVSRSMLGDEWPLTVESGVVYCNLIDGGHAVLFRVEDAGDDVDGWGLYAVNGWAQDHTDLPSIDPIWAAGTYAPKKNIGPILELGLSLCPP